MKSYISVLPLDGQINNLDRQICQIAAQNVQPEGKYRQSLYHYNLTKNLIWECRSKSKTHLTNCVSCPDLALVRLPGVPSITSKNSAGQRGVLETELKLWHRETLLVYVTISLRLSGVLNITSRNSKGRGQSLRFYAAKGSFYKNFTKKNSLY